METASKHSFYKILMDLTVKLGLPQGFTEKYGEILPKRAKLKVASGATWEVRVEKLEEEGYFFTTGWTEFCRDMELQMLEILVFSYVGTSTFHVSVYATTAFEKDSNFLVVKNPSFQVLLKTHHSIKFYVRSGFVEACGLIDKQKARLEYPDGQSREVVLKSWMRNGHPVFYFSKGWVGFCDANGLSVGKTYSFEFIERNKVIRIEPVVARGK